MNDPSVRDFGRVNRFLVGAIGEPGKRTFYLFIESQGLSSWFKCEKGQAAALGEQGLELLTNMGWDLDEDMVEALVSNALDMPRPSGLGDIPLRVRSMAMRIDSRDRMTLMLKGGGDDEQVMFTITAEQLRAAAILALKAVHSGRAQCAKCLLPEDPDGHYCPSGNGHRTPG